MRSKMNQFILWLSGYKKRIFSILVICLCVLPLIPKNEYYLDMIIMIFMWAALAGSWNMVGGFAGQISLGHSAFFGIGAYTSTILFLKLGITPWLGMFAGAGISIVVGLILGYACFRLTSHFFALATIAFAEVLLLLASFSRDLTGGGVGLLMPVTAGPENYIFQGKIPYLYISLILMLAVILVSQLIKNSKFGYYLTALRENHDAAESLGINTRRVKIYALLISVFFTSLIGSFFAQYSMFIDPEAVFASHISIQLALLSIIGGVGTVLGPIVGAFLLVPLDVILKGLLGETAVGLNFVIYGIILIVAVIYFPYGIVGWINRIIRQGKTAVRSASADTLHKPGAALAGLSPEDFGFEDDLNGSTVLEVKSLSKRFGGLQAVKDLDFHIKQGEIVSLVGPNGAGKTTVFNLLTGFIPPDTGDNVFYGKNLNHIKKPHKINAKHIGRTFQIVKPFMGLTVLENMMVAAFSRVNTISHAREEALRIIEFIGLKDKVNEYGYSLTLANRKRLELGRALATKPRLLLLDEVVAGLNHTETNQLIEIIKKINSLGVTILMIEHVMKAVMALSDRVVVINYGEKISEGLPEEVTSDTKVIEAYLGGEYHEYDTATRAC